MSIIPITKLFGLLICREHNRRCECVGSDGAEIIDTAVAAVVLGGNTDIAFRRRNGIVGEIQHVVSCRTFQLKFSCNGLRHRGDPLTDKAQRFAVRVFHCRGPGRSGIIAVAPSAEVEAAVRARRDPKCFIIQSGGIEVRGQVKIVPALIPAAWGALLYRLLRRERTEGVVKRLLQVTVVAHPVCQRIAELVKTLGEIDITLGRLVVIGIIEQEQRAQNQQTGDQPKKQRFSGSVFETEHISAQLQSGQGEQKAKNRQNLRSAVDSNAKSEKRNDSQYNQRYPETTGAEGGRDESCQNEEYKQQYHHVVPGQPLRRRGCGGGGIVAVIDSADTFQQILSLADKIDAAILIEIPEHSGTEGQPDQRAEAKRLRDPKQQA